MKTAIVGLGKMGISHLAILNAQEKVQMVGVCDNSAFLSDVVGRTTGIPSFTDANAMLDKTRPDAIFIATPSSTHAELVRLAIGNNINVFCEKPYCIDPIEGLKLAEQAESKNLINQVGYHCRFIAAFERAKEIIERGSIGSVYHAHAEVYGPVIVSDEGKSWRSARKEGGGCLNDYASHGLDLLNFFMGAPAGVGGTVLNQIHSREVEDEVYSNLFYADGRTSTISANWSDRSYRKMYVRVVLWGTNGKVIADRQEVQIYINDAEKCGEEKLRQGWTILNNTTLKKDVGYYLRGEEYSYQVEHFVASFFVRKPSQVSSFRSANITDTVVQLMTEDASETKVWRSLAPRSEQKTVASPWLRPFKRTKTPAS